MAGRGADAGAGVGAVVDADMLATEECAAGGGTDDDAGAGVGARRTLGPTAVQQPLPRRSDLVGLCRIASDGSVGSDREGEADRFR